MTELVDFKCSHCGSITYEVHLETNGEKVFLILSCADKECREKTRKELKGKENETVIWARFDVTEQVTLINLSESN